MLKLCAGLFYLVLHTRTLLVRTNVFLYLVLDTRRYLVGTYAILYLVLGVLAELGQLQQVIRAVVDNED